jgi:hypothetical protein
VRLIDAENRKEFEQLLLLGSDPKQRGGHHARMIERAQRFIGGMGDRSRTVFLEEAVEFAWQQRHTMNAQRESIDMYWERCLRHAALTRDKWLVNVGTLPGVFEKRWVLGRLLGEK